MSSVWEQNKAMVSCGMGHSWMWAWYNVICRLRRKLKNLDDMIQTMIGKDINLWCRAIQRAGIIVCFIFPKGIVSSKKCILVKKCEMFPLT